MLRICRSPLRWFALCALMAPAAARADQSSDWPVLETSAPAKTTGTAGSWAAQMASFEASLPNDPVAPIPDAPDSDAEPVAGKPAAGDSATPPSCMPNGGCACLGDCRRGFQTFVGVEALFLAPTQNTGGGTNYSVFNGSPTTPTNSYNSSSVSGMIVTPRLWLGIMGECWGVGVRYWQFNNGAGGPVFPSGTNAGLASAGFLKLQTFDLEAIRRIYYGNSQLWFSVGSRYAQFSHGSSISSTDFIGGGTATASAASGAGFNGTGITTGLFGLTPIGCSCWNLFYGGRVSYLWDTSAGAFAQSSAAFSSSGGSGAATHYATLTGGNSGLFIGEVQLGLQYNHALRCFPGIAFFRIAAEYQYWHVNNGLDANSFSGAGYYSSGTGVLNSVVATTTANGNSTLGLVGFGLSTGFMW